MVDPHQSRVKVWENAIASAKRSLDSAERCLVHPGNTALDTMIAGFWREVAACQLDALKATYKKISGE
jgi:hypothetical protein